MHNSNENLRKKRMKFGYMNVTIKTIKLWDASVGSHKTSHTPEL